MSTQLSAADSVFAADQLLEILTRRRRSLGLLPSPQRSADNENAGSCFINPESRWTDDHGQVWDRAKLKQQFLDKYKPLVDNGARVHVSEFGCYNKTPHDIVLAWLGDCLSLWHQANWGWAVWNLRGTFGVMDSGRTDVAYEDFQGHKLDRKMLELLRQTPA